LDEAIEWCNKALELTLNKSVKAYILMGCTLCIKAKLQKQHASQKALYDKALESFIK
jgi:hypothetical protein